MHVVTPILVVLPLLHARVIVGPLIPPDISRRLKVKVAIEVFGFCTLNLKLHSCATKVQTRAVKVVGTATEVTVLVGVGVYVCVLPCKDIVHPVTLAIIVTVKVYVCPVIRFVLGMLKMELLEPAE